MMFSGKIKEMNETDFLTFDVGEVYHFKYCSGVQSISKVLLDIIGAASGLIVFSPMIIIIALLIRLTSRGPILFKQQRLGLFGKPFFILKFRSMYDDKFEDAHKVYVENLLGNPYTEKDSDLTSEFKTFIAQRTTRLGCFLRKTSLDELPQFINVLRGEMSLVGPRPHPIYEVENYKEWYYLRMSVKPGITGLSKISIRCTPDNYDEAMRLDLRYVDKWSLWLDFKIIVKTIPMVILGNGAQ
jgi:lipopolysaccharide/colanic/teichoic acid biosynthesis glycosyltransferase